MYTATESLYKNCAPDDSVDRDKLDRDIPVAESCDRDMVGCVIPGIITWALPHPTRPTVVPPMNLFLRAQKRMMCGVWVRVTLVFFLLVVIG